MLRERTFIANDCMADGIVLSADGGSVCWHVVPMCYGYRPLQGMLYRLPLLASFAKGSSAACSNVLQGRLAYAAHRMRSSQLEVAKAGCSQVSQQVAPLRSLLLLLFVLDLRVYRVQPHVSAHVRVASQQHSMCRGSFDRTASAVWKMTVQNVAGLLGVLLASLPSAQWS